MLSRIDPGTSVGDWGTHESMERQESGSTSARGRPSSDEVWARRRIWPTSGVMSARRQATSVDLPAPEGPAKAVTVPGRMTPLVGAGPQAPRARTPTPSMTMSVLFISGQSMEPGRATSSAALMMSKAAREAVTPLADAWN